MKIAFIGRSQLLYNTLLALHNQGYPLGPIITAKASPEYTRGEDDFKRLAEHLQIPFLVTHRLDNPEVRQICNGLDIGISVNWPTVIQENHIRLFRLGILNAHLGDLPRYRGNACANWAIIREEEKIVTSIHFMEGGKLDCGRIVGQRQFGLYEETGIMDVLNWAEEIIPALFVEAIQKLDSDSHYILKYADPESPESFRCYPRLPEDGFIEWRNPVKEIHNLIRASGKPYPGAYTYHLHQGRLKKLIVLKSRIVQKETKDLAVPGHVIRNDPSARESWVQCGEGILALQTCRYEGETEEFCPGLRWKSIRLRLGIRAEDQNWNSRHSKVLD